MVSFSSVSSNGTSHERFGSFSSVSASTERFGSFSSVSSDHYAATPRLGDPSRVAARRSASAGLGSLAEERALTLLGAIGDEAYDYCADTVQVRNPVAKPPRALHAH